MERCEGFSKRKKFIERGGGVFEYQKKVLKKEVRFLSRERVLRSGKIHHEEVRD